MKEAEIRDRAAYDRYLELIAEDGRTYFDPSAFERVPCPACGTADSPRAFGKNGFEYARCAVCGTLYVDPRPRLADLVRYYTDSPSAACWVEDFFPLVAEARREKIFRPRAQHVVDRLPDLRDATIGDIGAGFGLFLRELRPLVPRARLVAIEPSAEQCAICSEAGLEVIVSALEDVSGFDGAFDLLTGFEILEHLHDPVAFLESAARLLKPGGHLLLTTVNGQGFDVALLGDTSRTVCPPAHLNLVNPSAVRTLLERTGFDAVEVATPGSLDWEIVEGAILDGVADLGEFWDRFARTGSPEAKEGLQEWIAGSGFSSHLRVLGRKEGVPNR